MQRHLDELSRDMGCDLVQGLDMPGMMYVEMGYVEGPTLNSNMGLLNSYYVCLHELGHFALGHTQGRPPHQDQVEYFRNGVLRSEAEAWEWAMDNALVPPNSLTRLFMWDTCLGSYYRHAVSLAGKPTRLTNGSRHFVEFTYDPPDDYFRAVRERIMCGDD